MLDTGLEGRKLRNPLRRGLAHQPGRLRPGEELVGATEVFGAHSPLGLRATQVLGKDQHSFTRSFIHSLSLSVLFIFVRQQVLRKTLRH